MVICDWPRCLVLILFGFLFACESGDEGQNPKSESSEGRVEDVAPTEASEQGIDDPVVDPALAADNQAEFASLMRAVPSDASLVLVLRDFDELAEGQIPGLQWDQAIQSLTGISQALDMTPLDAEMSSAVASCFPSLLEASKSDMTIWVHPGTTELVKAYLDSNELLSKTIGWGLGTVVSILPIKGSETFMGMNGFPFDKEAELRAERLANSSTEFGVTLLIAEGEGVSNEMLAEQWESMALSESVSQVSFESQGVKWEGVEWSLNEEVEDGLNFSFDPTGQTRLREAMLKRKPVLAVGMRGDQQVWFCGTRGAIDFSEEGEESMVDEVLSEQIAGRPGKVHVVSKMNPDLANLNWANYNVLSLLAGEYVARLRESDLFSDFRVFDVISERLAEIDEQVGKRNLSKPVTTFVYENEGIVYEQIGGGELYGIDYDTAQIPIDRSIFEDSTWCVFQGRSLPEAFETMEERQTLIATLVDEGISPLVGMDLHEDVKDEIEPFVELYDEVFRKNISDSAKAIFQFFDEGLSDEWALVIDAEGEYPALPDMPETLIEKGRAPRLAFGWPMGNRAYAKKAWEVSSTAISESVLAFGKQYDSDVKIPTPISDEGEGGIKHYYYSVPFTNNNCLPCLSLSDEALAFGTAKKVNQMLVQAWQRDGAELKPFTGIHGTLFIAPLADIVADLVEYGNSLENENLDIQLDELDDPAEPMEAEELADDDPSLSEKMLKGIRNFEKIDFQHVRRNGDIVTRMHLKRKKTESKKLKN